VRPSKILKAVNWRHAVGELLLIVAGILIALAISDWNDRRIQRQGELALLVEVRTALQADLAALESNLETFREAESRIEQLAQVLREAPPYESALDRLFGAVYGIRVTNLNTAAYDTLRSVGFQSISNHRLRLGIAEVYDHYYERLTEEHEIEFQITIDMLRPYYLRHFTALSFWESATPIDYDAVVADTYFKNMIDYRLAALRSNQLASYALAAGEIRSVLELIDEELDRG
jgi:Asp-tRNA(Asn)/Glu-tRNA(Gln) amidotransferase A subunit family amidase